MKRIIQVCLLIIVACTLSSCNWLYSMGIGVKSNLRPPAPLTRYQPQLHVQKLWDTRTGFGTQGKHLKLAVSLRGGLVYTANAKGYVTALNAANGDIVWQDHVRAPIVSGPSVKYGLVAVNTGNGYLTVLDAHSGAMLWNHELPNEALAAPTFAAGSIFDKTINGVLVAFNAKTGHKLWQYNHGAPLLILRGSSSPQYGGGRIVAGFADGRLVTLNKNTGNIYWERTIAVPKGTTQVEQMVDIDADPRISDGMIFVATYQGNIAALTLDQGNIVWRHKISSYTGIAVAGTQVFVSDASSHVWAFNRYAGGVNWLQSKLDYRFITGPAVMNSVHAIVVGDKKGYLHWLSQADGRLLARVEVGRSGIIATPEVSGNIVYTVTKDGKVAAYRVTPIHH